MEFKRYTQKIGGITVENELEWLWKDKILSASVDEPVSKSVLCHRNGAGAHPAFIRESEVKKYENAMTLVAMAITGEQWGQFCSGRWMITTAEYSFCWCSNRHWKKH